MALHSSLAHSGADRKSLEDCLCTTLLTCSQFCNKVSSRGEGYPLINGLETLVITQRAMKVL